MVVEVPQRKEDLKVFNISHEKDIKKIINEKLIEERFKLKILPILMIFLEGKYGKRESYRIYRAQAWEKISRPTYFKRINELAKLGYLNNESNGKYKDSFCLSEKAIELLINYQLYFKEFLPEITELLISSPLYSQLFDNFII